MKKIIVLVIAILSFDLVAKEFSLLPTDNNSTYDWKVVSGISTVINCSKFLTTFDVTNATNPKYCTEYDVNDEDCLNFVDITSAEINNSTNACPKLALDGKLYTINGDVNIYQRNRLMIVNPTDSTNCVKEDGTPPTIGFTFILAYGNTTIGIDNISFNYNNWILEMESKDGDLTCVGSIGNANDAIFKNDFEIEL